MRAAASSLITGALASGCRGACVTSLDVRPEPAN